jgi:hypothetical protein
MRSPAATERPIPLPLVFAPRAGSRRYAAAESTIARRTPATRLDDQAEARRVAAGPRAE